MKEQTGPAMSEVMVEAPVMEELKRESSKKQIISQNAINNNNYNDNDNNNNSNRNRNIESDEDSGYVHASNVSLVIEDEINVEPELPRSPEWKLKVPPKKKSEVLEEEAVKNLKSLLDTFETIPENEKRQWLYNELFERLGKVLTKSLIENAVGQSIDGDSGISMDVKPEWLDMEKFRRGQKFAQEYLFGIFYAELISLFTVFSFEHGLKPIIATGASSTPYTAFKRYLSTGTRVRNWYTSDPWTPGTAAYNDIRAVRRMHSMVRKNSAAMSEEEYNEKSAIKNSWCPTLSATRRDFESCCPAPAAGQCFYLLLKNHPSLKTKFLTQGDMAGTQFAFIGLVILYPKFFGIHVSEEELDAFCHLWRGIGYLLGIDDKDNFCRGTVEDVRTRSRDFLELWVKPNFRIVFPEWEHMMRCVVEGLQYYFPGSTYETCLLDLAEIMDLHMPRMHESISYSLWIRHGFIRYYFQYFSKIPGLRSFMNYRLNRSIDLAHQFNKEKHKKLQEKSEKTLESHTKELQKSKTSPIDSNE